MAMRDGRYARLGRARLRRERGSALLIVFVFSAMIAIMLYMELPVAAFEAERNKEQLLIDRGNEYAHAVKLFVRKFGMYPASVAQLENTNRIRFLRHRFKDPLTGNDDWRLLHAGPNGQLLDSKVTPIGKTSNGTSTNSGSTAAGPLAANASSETATSAFNSTSTSSPAEVTVPAVPQRPPAIAANGSSAGIANASQPDQNPTTPLLPPTQPANNGDSTQAAGVQPQGQATGQNGGQPADQNGAQPNATQGSAQPGAQTPGAPGTPNGMNTVRGLLNNPNPVQTNSSPMGTITSGGIAGVASKAEGHSIKMVNDQSQYPLWEFYYDPTKDATRAMASAAQIGAAQSAAQIAGQNSQNSQNSAKPNAPAPNSQTETQTEPVPDETEPENPPQQ